MGLKDWGKDDKVCGNCINWTSCLHHYKIAGTTNANKCHMFNVKPKGRTYRQWLESLSDKNYAKQIVNLILNLPNYQEHCLYDLVEKKLKTKYNANKGRQ